MQIEATYSPEDNKLRLYATARLDEETYQRVRDAGFRWAPKQELFVAPSWTPAREDLAIELAGSIEPESMTLAERAQIKAERLDGYREKRERDAGHFSRVADQISERFAMGQPILIGHHSERKARKDQERAHNAQRKAIRMQETANYWAYRAEGVERHANQNHNPRTRQNRIKKLLAELRGFQRTLNFSRKALKLWEAIDADQDHERRERAIRHYSGTYDNDGQLSPYGTWGELEDGKKTPQEVVDLSIKYHLAILNSEGRARWIAHTLNRLEYERGELGPVPRFEGEFTAGMIQTFCREQGADKPKAERIDNGWRVSSTVPLPVHLAEGLAIELSGDGWRDLMQACGHVPAKPSKSTKPPLLNINAESLNGVMYGRENCYPVRHMTKAEYKRIHSDYKGGRVSTCGQFRFRTAMVEGHNLVAVFLTDSKEHDMPKQEDAA